MSQDLVSYRRRLDCGTLRLADAVGISEASAIHAAAQRAAQDSHVKSVRLDLEAVTRIDLSVIQILSALEQDLRRQGKTRTMGSVSDPVRTAYSYAGLAV